MAVDALEDGRTGRREPVRRARSRAKATPPRRAVVDEVFETCDRAWRGIGVIPKSGYRLRPELAAFDATLKFDVGAITTEEPKECIAGRDHAGPQAPERVPRVRDALHARAPARRADGVVRGRLRRLLALREGLMARPTPPPAPDLGAALAAASVPRARGIGRRTILMAHGGGGRLTQRLIESVFLKSFDNPALARAARRRDPRGRRRPPRVLDGLVRDPPAVLPGRRHRLPRRARHGERPRDVRRAAARALGGPHPRGGPADRGPRAHRRLDAARRLRRGRARSSRATRRSWTAARATASS